MDSTALRRPKESSVTSEKISVVFTASRRPEASSATSEETSAGSTTSRRPEASSATSEETSAGSTALRRPEVSSGMAKVFLYPRAGYVPKVPSVTPHPDVLQAFSPPPFREPDQQKLNCMCPVRALGTYVYRTTPWKNAYQLLIYYAPLNIGLPASKQTLSRWILDAINMSYKSSDLPLPMGVKAHSTRSVAASKAFFAGVPLQDICNAAVWSTPLIFVRFYGLDIRAPGSSVLSP